MLGQQALAVTDVFHLGSAFRLRRLCLEAGIKPIVGMDTLFSLSAPQELFSARTGNLTLLATGPDGWKSLVAIHNTVHADPQTPPLLTPRILSRHNAGLTVLSGGAGGPLAAAAEAGDLARARHILNILTAAVTPQALRIVVSGLETDPVWELLNTLAAGSAVELAAVQLVEYLDQNQSRERAAFCAARAGVRLDDRCPEPRHPAHLVTAEQMFNRRASDPRWQRALAETANIAAGAVDSLPSPQVRVPEVTPAEPDVRLRELVYERAASLPMSEEVRGRLTRELDAIAEAGTAAAFLVVAETHDWMGAEAILSNSRSSVNCSLVLHCLGVAETNPLEAGLPFDRFLADTSDGMPAVNLDIPSGSRTDVEDFLAAEYGSDKVARVAAFPRIRTRRAIKDAARTLGEKKTGQQILKSADAEASVADLLAAPGLTRDQQEVLQLASAIEGAPAAQAVDAGSIVVSGEPLQSVVPVRPSPDGGLPVICLNSEDVRSLGFLKMEFQGLPVLERTAQTLQSVPELAADPVGAAAMIADSASDPSDPLSAAAWDLLAKGDTDGVFLMSNPANLPYARKAAPRTLDDLAALTALNRPGFTDETVRSAYLQRTGRPADCARYTPDTREQDTLHRVLGRSGGLILFQEQITTLFQVLAGTAGEEAEAWRQVLQDGDDTEREEVRELFLARSTETLDPGTAARVFDALLRAGTTAFSGSHAHAQARLTFVDAWLAANHPRQFRQAH